MAAKRVKPAPGSTALNRFNPDETVQSWLRLATQSRGKFKNNVQLRLSINLDSLVATESPDKEALIHGLVKLVGLTYVESVLVLAAAEPGGGHQSLGTRPGAPPAGSPVAAPPPALPSSIEAPKGAKSAKRGGRK